MKFLGLVLKMLRNDYSYIIILKNKLKERKNEEKI